MKGLQNAMQAGMHGCSGFVWKIIIVTFYVDDGVKSENVKIPGVLHTVNPVANDSFPIYKENAREFFRCSAQKIFGTVFNDGSRGNDGGKN